MKTLYESILKSTGSGKKSFLKSYLMNNGWIYINSTRVLRNDKYPSPSQYLKVQKDDTIFVGIYIMSVLYNYEVVDLDDLKLVTDYWEAYNEVDFTKHKDAVSRKKKTDAYKALKKGLKLREVWNT